MIDPFDQWIVADTTETFDEWMDRRARGMRASPPLTNTQTYDWFRDVARDMYPRKRQVVTDSDFSKILQNFHVEMRMQMQAMLKPAPSALAISHTEVTNNACAEPVSP